MRKNRQWHPDVGRIDHFGSGETGRGDADDRVIAAVELHRLAGNIRVASEAPLPATITDDGDRMAVLVEIVFPMEDAASHGANAEHVEVIAANRIAPDEGVIPASAAEADLRDAVGDETRENVVAIPDIAVIGKGQNRKLGLGKAHVASDKL